MPAGAAQAAHAFRAPAGVTSGRFEERARRDAYKSRAKMIFDPPSGRVDTRFSPPRDVAAPDFRPRPQAARSDFGRYGRFFLGDPRFSQGVTCAAQSVSQGRTKIIFALHLYTRFLSSSVLPPPSRRRWTRVRARLGTCARSPLCHVSSDHDRTHSRLSVCRPCCALSAQNPALFSTYTYTHGAEQAVASLLHGTGGRARSQGRLLDRGGRQGLRHDPAREKPRRMDWVWKNLHAPRDPLVHGNGLHRGLQRDPRFSGLQRAPRLSGARRCVLPAFPEDACTLHPRS